MRIYPVSINNNMPCRNKQSRGCCQPNAQNVNFGGKKNAIKFGAGALGGMLVMIGVAAVAGPALLGGLLATGAGELLVGGTAAATAVGAMTEDEEDKKK